LDAQKKDQSDNRYGNGFHCIIYYLGMEQQG